MKNILIIGCGLIGSSLLRAIANKRMAKKIFIYEKSKSTDTAGSKWLNLEADFWTRENTRGKAGN